MLCQFNGRSIGGALRGRKVCDSADFVLVSSSCDWAVVVALLDGAVRRRVGAAACRRLFAWTGDCCAMFALLACRRFRLEALRRVSVTAVFSV